MNSDKWIRLAPDFGHPSGLWGTPKVAIPRGEARLYVPADFGLSKELADKLELFNDAFLENFTVNIAWRRGFDVARWIRLGDEILRQMTIELPEYRVEQHFRKYSEYPQE